MPIVWGEGLPPDHPIFDGRLIMVFKNAPPPEPEEQRDDDIDENDESTSAL